MWSRWCPAAIAALIACGVSAHAEPSSCQARERRFTRVQDLPIGVRPPPGTIADPGQMYNPGDVVDERNPIPRLQLVDAVQRGCSLVLREYHGGFVSGARAVTFHFDHGKWRVIRTRELTMTELKSLDPRI